MKSYQAFAVCIFFFASPLPAVASASGTIQGRVTIDGQPAQGIPVLLDSPDHLTLQTQSDTKGYYCFAGVEIGTYVIHAVPSGGLPADIKVTVTQDTTVSADLKLRRGPTLEEIKRQMGPEAIDILAGATRVQAFRVCSSDEASKLDQGHTPQALSPAFTRVDGWHLLGTAKEQGRVLARKLRQILLDEHTYTYIELECVTRPGVIFRLWKGTQSLDILLCFHCGEMYTITHDSTGKARRGIYTPMWGDSRLLFTHLAKEAFPNDPIIQAL